jgi:hypothetical protein
MYYLLIDKLMPSSTRNPYWRLLTVLSFPTWIPAGTRAALFHGERQVTKGIPAYIQDAAHTPALKKYRIRCSNEATGRDQSWADG